MKRRNVYAVQYKVRGFYELPKMVCVIASSKAEAYDLAFYEAIPKTEGQLPYSAWVSSVTYNNGNAHYFNTSEGNAY